MIEFSEGVQPSTLSIGQADSEVERVGGLKRRCTALFWINSWYPCNSQMCPTVIDKKVANRINLVTLTYPMVILSVHGSPGGRTLPLPGYGRMRDHVKD